MTDNAFKVVFGVEQVCAKRPEGVPADPEFTAGRDERFRYQRLHVVLGHACTTVRTMSYRHQGPWDGAIIELEDGNGVLSVTWRDEMSCLAFEDVVVGAWEANGEHSYVNFLANRR